MPRFFHTSSSDLARAASGASSPGAAQNTSEGYKVSDIFVNTSTNKAFVLVDALLGDWRQIDNVKVTSTTVAPTINDDSIAGYTAGSIWNDTSGGNVYVCTDSTSGAAVWKELATRITNNYTATVNPTVNDDTGSTYSIGSFWKNTATNSLWLCTDSTVGAAQWSQLTQQKHNYTAVLNPTSSDNYSAGYTAGSFWLNSTTNKLYVCQDPGNSLPTDPTWVLISDNRTTKTVSASPNDDALYGADDGFQQGDTLLDTANNILYVATDLSVEATPKWKGVKIGEREVVTYSSALPTNTEDSSAGYAIGDFWFTTNGLSLVCTDSTVGAAVWGVIGYKNNVVAATPTTTNNNSEGYAVGSIWHDITDSEQTMTYICSAADSTTATWELQTKKFVVDSINMAPLITDDIDSDYLNGSLKVGSQNDTYLLKDNASGAAEWLNLITQKKVRFGFDATSISSGDRTSAVPYARSFNGSLLGSLNLSREFDGTISLGHYAMYQVNSTTEVVYTFSSTVSLLKGVRFYYEASPTDSSKYFNENNFNFSIDVGSGMTPISASVDFSISNVDWDEDAAVKVCTIIFNEAYENVVAFQWAQRATGSPPSEIRINEIEFSTEYASNQKSNIISTDIGGKLQGVWEIEGYTQNEKKNNLTATVNPLITDDSSKSYEPGSIWVNTISNGVFICTNATINSAKWVTLSTLDDDDTLVLSLATNYGKILYQGTGINITDGTNSISDPELNFNISGTAPASLGNSQAEFENNFYVTLNEIKTTATWTSTTTFSINQPIYFGDILRIHRR